jgi:maleylacetoacetate isomerase
VKLFCYWRSQAAFRVRVALNLKGVAVEDVYVDLLKGEQFEDGYRKVNPQMVVPTLVTDGGVALYQSLPIIEYLEETHPAPPLLPADALGRARVRGLAQIATSDAHPLIVPRVRNYLESELGLDEPARMKWIRHWLTAALAAYEQRLFTERETGRYAHGDSVSLADICVVQQVVASRVFGCDLAPYTTTLRIADECMKLPAFANAHPLKQPDAPSHH